MATTVYLPDGAAHWMENGERGISSAAIFHQMTGLAVYGKTSRAFGDHPSDPADLRRCRLLLEEVPEFLERFEAMRGRSKVWAKLVDAWPELCALMDAECPQWRAGNGGRAEKTYDRMKQLGC